MREVPTSARFLAYWPSFAARVVLQHDTTPITKHLHGATRRAVFSTRHERHMADDGRPLPRTRPVAAAAAADRRAAHPPVRLVERRRCAQPILALPARAALRAGGKRGRHR